MTNNIKTNIKKTLAVALVMFAIVAPFSKVFADDAYDSSDYYGDSGYEYSPSDYSSNDNYDYSSSNYYSDDSSSEYSPSDYYSNDNSSSEYSPSDYYSNDNSSSEYSPSDYYANDTSEYSPSDYYSDDNSEYSPSDYYSTDNSEYSPSDYYASTDSGCTYGCNDNSSYDSGSYYDNSYQSTPSYYDQGYSTGCTSGCATGLRYPTAINYPINVPQGCTGNCNPQPIPQPQPPVLNGSCTGLPSNAQVNQTITWSASASGGNGNYNYSWSGAASGSGRTVTNVYSTPGTKTAVVSINSNGQTITRNCSINIQQVNSNIYCLANPSNVQIGQTVTFTAYVSNGNGNNSYVWSGDVSGNGQTITTTYNTAGTKTAQVAVISNGQTIYGNCSVYVGSNNYPPVYNNMTGSCYANVTNPTIGQTVTFYANAQGGNGNYNYSWSGDVSGNGQAISQTFWSAGTKTAYLTIYSNGQTISNTCQVYVGGNNGGAISVVSNNTPSGPLTSGVYLSQVPYTGISGGLGLSLFILGLFFWSAVIAWYLLKKRQMKEGISRSEAIRRFKEENFRRKTAQAAELA